MGRITNFIDAAYLEKLARSAPGMRIDFDAMAARLAEGHDLLRSYYYDALPYLSDHPTAAERERMARKNKFLTALSYIPRFEVRIGELQCRGTAADGTPLYQQKRVDVQIAVDLVALAVRQVITHASIVAGDSDFIPAIETAKACGVVIHLFHGSNAHRDLLRLSDERTLLSREWFRRVTEGSNGVLRPPAELAATSGVPLES